LTRIAEKYKKRKPVVVEDDKKTLVLPQVVNKVAATGAAFSESFTLPGTQRSKQETEKSQTGPVEVVTSQLPSQL